MFMEKNDKGFKMVHLNVCSLRNKIDTLSIFIDNLNLKIISLSETWLNDQDNNDLLKIDTYKLIRHDRQWQDADGTTKKEEA